MDSALPEPGAWFGRLLAELDAGELTPREAAVKVLTESSMLLGITIDHIAWELSAAVLRGDAERSRRYAELFLYLADPSYSRRPPPAAKPSTANTPQGDDRAAPHAPKEEARVGLYL